ncbi:nitrogen fixation protein NifH, partial [Candidatus Bathyarchaeota archaeon]|nr:nitrogen fixation protein NifH [Candidatus Bathyarchaeota archaeon]
MWKDKLKKDRTEWLLEPSDPSVRYWALKALLDLEEDHPDVVDARDMIMESPIVTAIHDAMNPEGYWENPDDMYLPKYTATTHQLLILTELGARRTPGIEKAVEHLFKFQRNSGHFLTEMPKTERGRDSAVKDGCCLDGN